MSSLLQQIKSLDINKQNTLTPGDNISIVDNVISSTASGSGTTNPVVSFKARGVSSATSGIAPYNTIIFNYGSGYDATTFKFTVPYEGVYLFYYTYGTAVDGDTVIMNLKRTRNSVTTVEKNTFLDNVIADTDHTETFTMFCEVGDEVFVESQSTRFILSFNKSWFGGFLTGDTSSGITQAQLDVKQDTLTAGDNITITGDVISSTGGITQAQLDTKQDTLTAGDNITITGDVISSTGGITQAQLDTKQDVLTAGDNITITGNVISSSGGITQAQLDAKQDLIISTTDISLNSLTSRTGTFTDTVNITNTPLLITDEAVNITSQLITKGETFDTIILRRISGDTTMNIREIQLWINDINVLPTNTNPSQNQDNLSLGDKVEFFIQNANGSFSTRNALQSYIASNSVNNIIGDNLDTHSESSDNASLYIPLTSTFNIADNQSFVLYNRTFSSFGNRSIGLQFQIYNRVDDPTFSNPLVITNTITEGQAVYRFDFPAISTYTGFDSIDSTDFITSTALISTDLTFGTGQEPEIAVALKIVDGRLETNQEISTKNVIVADTTPTLDNELTSKAYVDALIANLQAQIDAMTP